ncbi:MAG: DUF305 domain-containing protein [Acidimicrobiia bacterium]
MDRPGRVDVVFVVALCLLTGVIGHKHRPRGGDDSFNAADVGFLRDMTTHHDSAIGLGFDYLGREHDALVGHFAREIVMAQSQEVAVMNSLASRANEPETMGADVAMDWMGMAMPPGQMPGMPTWAESAQLRRTGIAADDLFTSLMIHHHAGGVAMAEYAAKHGENAAVRNLARSMARVQRGEIIEMNNHRATLGLPAIDVTDEMTATGHAAMNHGSS